MRMSLWRKVGILGAAHWVLLLSLWPHSQYSHLSQLPKLMVHYQAHLAEEPMADFASFLIQHYFTEHAQAPMGQPGAHDHSELPLHSYAGVAPAFIPLQILDLPALALVQATYATYAQLAIGHQPAPVLQPPRA